MKTHSIFVAAFGSLALACSPQTAPEQDRESAITVRGTNTENIRSLPLAIEEVSVTADGNEVAVATEPAPIDLARGEEHRAARFVVPENARSVKVTIRFDDYGGFETRDGEAGVLDARGTSVTLEVPARELSDGKAEIALDLARSVVPRKHGMRAFTPHARMTF